MWKMKMMSLELFFNLFSKILRKCALCSVGRFDARLLLGCFFITCKFTEILYNYK